MPAAFRPEGAWTALVTPFDSKGKVDSVALKRLVEFQIAQGITGVLPVGTTGESPTLSWDEHNQVIEETIAFVKERVPVLAGTGSNSTEEAIDATRHARAAGASAVLLVDCYYNGPSSLELRTEYYEQVAEWVPDIPIIPYVIPGRTGTALGAEDLAILHRNQPKRFPAVKQATGDLARMRQDRALAGSGLAIMSGDDDLTLTMMEDAQISAAGVISVMTNIVPGAVAKMVAASRSGDKATAKDLNAKLEPLFKLVVCKVPGSRKLPNGQTVNTEDKFRNPVPVKTMMAGLGMPVGLCRRPLGKMTRAGVERCREALAKVQATAPELLAPIAQAFGVNIAARLKDAAVWAALGRE
ncbi:MAG TPA: 4-hydroxy-tetrahydrodipicolinate synthase [Planctomycetota bacterium]|jgi:4-hydroxy-tetrahydrodipicolinate synthase